MTAVLFRDFYHTRVTLLGDENELVPLSMLANIDTDAYTAALAKYDDTPERQRLRETVIPGLGRKWTEVVFLSTVHPHAIWLAWQQLTGQELPAVEFWAIPATTLSARAVVLDRTRSAVGEPIDPTEVTSFEAATFQTAAQTTPANRAWLATLASQGLKGAWFNGIPQVLVPGPVSLESATSLRWDTPAS